LNHAEIEDKSERGQALLGHQAWWVQGEEKPPEAHSHIQEPEAEAAFAQGLDGRSNQLEAGPSPAALFLMEKVSEVKHASCNKRGCEETETR
jgi:hypothetical protein